MRAIKTPSDTLHADSSTPFLSNRSQANTLPTGYPGLDELLPGGGWPANTVTEIVAPTGYLDPVTVLLPMLARQTRSDINPRWIAWIAPPYLPLADDLSDQGIDVSKILFIHRHRRLTPFQLVKRALASGRYLTLLAWIDQLDRHQLRELNQTARRLGTTVFLFRPAAAERQPSDAELKVFLSTHSPQLDLEILHCRCRPGTALRLAPAGGAPLFTPRYYARPRWPRPIIVDTLGVSAGG